MKKGFLATDSMYICIKHDDETLQKYYNAFEQVLYEIKDVISDEDKFDTYDIKEAYKGFQRLN